MKNFFKRYIDIVDKWFLVDNSGETFEFIAEGTKDGLIIKNEKKWSELKRNNDGN
jgi:hypothetical protein